MGDFKANYQMLADKIVQTGQKNIFNLTMASTKYFSFFWEKCLYFWNRTLNWYR